MEKNKSVPMPLSCRRKMTTQEIIQKILAANSELTEVQLAEKIQAEKNRYGGLLGDETILRLIAARYGVAVQQNNICNSGTLSSSRLFAGLHDVTVAGRLIAVFPVKTFEGEKPGKFATIMIVDNDGILRVMLWNKKAELVERAELKAGQTVRLMHGYTREDRSNNVELHLGEKSQIEVEPTEKSSQYPPIEKFTSKINSLNKPLGAVHVCGKVKQVLGANTFNRSDSTQGTLLRFVLFDDSGEITAVAWNEKASELSNIKVNTRLQIVNAKVKEGMKGGFEVHIDSGTFVSVHDSPETSFFKASFSNGLVGYF
jgi:ssDNA-binding replication factor A large subunit